jgi:inward rectifier potassium channel
LFSDLWNSLYSKSDRLAQEHQQHTGPSSGPHPGAPEREIGFGSKVYGSRVRMINPDGTTNVRKRGRGWFRPYDIYQKLILMPQTHFAGGVVLVYLIVNLVFSSAYMLAGMESLAGVTGTTLTEQFLDAFFFSAQTVTTLGYGRIAPVGALASSIAAFESLLGLLGFALATGLLYGRFSRPNARIKFSDMAVLAPYEGKSGFMFRMVNERTSELIEAEVQVMLSYIDLAAGKRDFDILPLEISKINLFAMSWTIVHAIDEESMLWGKDEKYLETIDAEFIILVKAFDDSFGTVVYQRRSYKFWEVLRGKKFVPISEPVGGHIAIDIHRLSEVIDAPLPPIAIAPNAHIA